MRRMTECAALMVAMTFAMTAAPQKAEASLWDSLITLTGGEPVENGWVLSWQRIRLRNNTTRHALFDVYAGGNGRDPWIYDEYGNIVSSNVYVPPGGEVWIWADMSYLCIRTMVWRSDRNRWVLKTEGDRWFNYGDGDFLIEFYKVSRGVFAQRRW